MTLASLIGGDEILPKNIIEKIEELIAPTLNITTNDLCRNHSEIYIQGLRNRESWAYQMLDSSAKLQAGMLTGNMIAMGDFDECISVANVKTEFGTFKGKHCLATLTWSNGSFLSTKELFKSLQMCVDQNMVGSNTAIFAFVGCLVILSTSYDLIYTGNKREYYLIFSIYTNGKTLMSIKTTKDSVSCLHGLRFLSICWIVLGHRYMVSTEGPAINETYGMEYVKHWKSMLIANSQLGVDTFLVLSGFLVSYIFLKQMNSGSRETFNILKYYLHRYI
ncbi:hypothetical protein L9F63_015462, partial [Diploptera punctata]